MRPVEHTDGFLPISDHGLVGDGATAALIGRDGGVAWLCAPRFDSPPLFCPILDPERGGQFAITVDGRPSSTQRYVDDTGVLVTEMEGGSGRVRITDALALHRGADLMEGAAAARGELLRKVEAVGGAASVEVVVESRPGGRVEGGDHTLRLRFPSRGRFTVTLQSSRHLDGARTRMKLEPGKPLFLSLCWHRGTRRASAEFEDRMEWTIDAWRRWARCISYEGPHSQAVVRSAITLKLLDHFENGAIVAAPTSSLPEWPGGSRNWDYRYAWIRDAAFSVYALRRVGMKREAAGFVGWVLEEAEEHERPRVLYTLDGDEVDEETVDDDLRGYLDSRPVRWGNSATLQRQHDVYGEIIDCAWQWVVAGGEIDRTLWDRLRPLIESAGNEWREPDAGIWEIRCSGRPFTYSAALCQVALDRGARLAERLGFPGDAKGWRKEAKVIVEAILEEAWNEEAGAITESLKGEALDASVLSLPLRRLLPADHPKMVATSNAIAHRLSAGDGLLYRYRPDESPDGIDEPEGAFLLCSFWLVDNLAGQGRLDEAIELFDSLCARTNEVGLLPEMIDPSTGRFLGNFPQAFSHVGVISSAVTLARQLAERENGER